MPDLTLKDAKDILELWKENIEIYDLLSKIFPTLPETLLPFPRALLEEVLNITAKDYFDAGDEATSKAIRDTIGILGFFDTDVMALSSMGETIELMKRNPQLKDLKLNNLKKARASWNEARPSSPK